MITIIVDEGKNGVGEQLYQALLSQNVETDYISLENVGVKACFNCNGCSYRTYGKCVIRDDGDFIYPKVIASDVLVLVTSVVFGGYSFKMKRVLDKFGLIMDRHYYVKDKELVKGGLPGRQFKLFSIGVSENLWEEEAEIFKRLVHETIVITRGAGKAYVISPELDTETKDEIVQEVLRA